MGKYPEMPLCEYTKKGTIMSASPELITVDVGNARIKLGRYDRTKLVSCHGVPQPEQVIFSEAEKLLEIKLWLRESPLAPGTSWLISSVNSQLEQRLTEWIAAHRPDDCIQILTRDDINVPTDLEFPDAVGMDRLCNAKAALRLKNDGEPSLVVDLGTAITLDVLSGNGLFRGGAIMPGFSCAAQGLHDLTEQLPRIDVEELRLPDFPGKNTTAAIQAGLFWGIIGAVRQFLSLAQEERPALLILTGGNSYQVWEALLNPYANSKTDSIVCEATRIEDSSGVFTPPPHANASDTQESQSVPDNGFIPVHRFHEVICCPYLTLSGIALCAKSSCK